MFGTQYVGAIHGMLITAWSAAGIFGPVLVNYIRQYQLDHGTPSAQAYNVSMYVMACLLVIGFFCNYSSRPSTNVITWRWTMRGAKAPQPETRKGNQSWQNKQPATG